MNLCGLGLVALLIACGKPSFDPPANKSSADRRADRAEQRKVLEAVKGVIAKSSRAATKASDTCPVLPGTGPVPVIGAAFARAVAEGREITTNLDPMVAGSEPFSHAYMLAAEKDPLPKSFEDLLLDPVSRSLATTAGVVAVVTTV